MPSKRAFASGMSQEEAPSAETCAAARANTKKACPEEHAFQLSIYRYIEVRFRQVALFRMFEIRCDKQRHFACLAFFVLSPFLELIAAFTAPINAGATDTATMPKTMTSK